MGKIKYQTITSRTDFFYYTFRNMLLVALPLTLILAFLLSLPHSSATSSGTDRIEFSLSVSCTLSSVVNNEHSASINSGTYTSGVGKTTITTLCNDGNGYAVYANGYSNNEEGNNKLINSESPQNSIDTGLATSGLTSAWAMRLDNVVNDPTPPTIANDYNATYGLIPNYYTKVAEKASGTTDMSQGSSFTTTYAVYASSSQYTGTYVGQVKYVLTHPSNKAPIYYMQDVADWKNELSLEESVQAIDKRDGKSYWVTKLKDGHVWMTQNLDFDINANTVLNSDTTDLNVAYNTSTNNYREYRNGYTIGNDGMIYWMPVNNAITIHFTGTTVAGWQNNATTPYSASKIDDSNTGHVLLGNYYSWTTAIASNDSSTLTGDTVNNISQNPKNSICPKGWRLPTISNESEIAANSTNEFARLNNLYNDNKTNTDADWIAAPLWFVRGGAIENGNTNGLTNFGVYGRYWSSTVENSQYAYLLALSSSYVQPGKGTYSYSRGMGRSIRCLAK